MSESNITKLALASSIKELMETTSLKKISVSDIVNHCHLNRQTFYYHFRDKYDLVNWIYYTESIEHMKKLADKDRWAEGMCELCQYMQDNKKFYINALKITGQNSFSEYLLQFSHELILSFLQDLIDSDAASDKDLDFIAYFFSYAFVGTICKWAETGMKEPPQEHVQRIAQIVDEGILKKVLNNKSGVDKSLSEQNKE